MQKASFVQALANIQADIAPALLFEMNTHYLVGAIRIKTADNFWEQHNGGDEILIILQGRADFTLQPEFDPSKSDHVFRLGMDDYTEIVFLLIFIMLKLTNL